MHEVLLTFGFGLVAAAILSLSAVAFTLEYAQSGADILFLERASIVNIVGGLVAGGSRVGSQVGAASEQ